MPTPSPARLLGDVVRLNILVMPPSARTTAGALIIKGAADSTSKPTAPIASPSRVTTSVRLTLLRRRISELRLTLLRSAALRAYRQDAAEGHRAPSRRARPRRSSVP